MRPAGVHGCVQVAAIETAGLSLAVPRWRELPKGDDPRTDHRRVSLVSPGLASQRDRFPIAKQGRLLYQRHCSVTPRSRGVGTPTWAGPLTTSLWGIWVSGYLPRAMADRAQGRRPDNRPSDTGGGLITPGLASQRERFPTARRLSNQRGLRL